MIVVSDTKNFKVIRSSSDIFTWNIRHKHILVAWVKYIDGSWVIFYSRDYVIFGFSFEEQSELYNIFEQINEVVI